MGEAPGTIRRFTPEQVLSKKVRTRYSLHEGDLLDTLKLSQSLGKCPGDIAIFGIEPKEISPGEGLSEELQSNSRHYVETILKELEIHPHPDKPISG